MLKPRFHAHAASAVLLVALAGPALAQGQTSSGNTVDDRLFLSFIEDAKIVETQWWEGRAEYADGDIIESTLVRGIVAFRPWDSELEVGGRVGFGSTDTPAPLPDGEGGTDFDLWAKYHVGSDSNDTDYVVGGVLTIPTGDDTAGLGNDAFGASVFGALRYQLQQATIAAHIGFRFNGDAEILGLVERDGEVSAQLGAAVIYPLRNDSFSVIGELDFEGERFDGADDAFRVLGGLNWRVGRQGMVRGAVAAGLSDGAPDAEFLIGYAAQF